MRRAKIDAELLAAAVHLVVARAQVVADVDVEGLDGLAGGALALGAEGDLRAAPALRELVEEAVGDALELGQGPAR